MLRDKISVVMLLVGGLLLLVSCSPETAGKGEPMQPQSVSAVEHNTAKKIPLAYTQEYALFEGETGSDGSRLVGLIDKQGTELLPAIYRQISVSDKGIIFTDLAVGERAVYRVFDTHGAQIGGDYSWIECASPNADGMVFYRGAVDSDMAPVPPYAAHIEDGTGKRSYWLLDENGAALEDEPYDAMELHGDGGAAMTRNNLRYSREPDGTVTVSGGEVAQSYFDGKYQVKAFHPFLHGRYLSLEDKDGKEITPGKLHSSIDVPFADRYVLYDGTFGYMGGEQAFLYDDNNTLLASNSHHYSFVVEQDGSYAGISTVWNIFSDDNQQMVEAEGDPIIIGEDGKPELAGQYFVDKNGKRLSERHKAIVVCESVEEMKETFAKADGYGIELASIVGDIEKIGDRAGSGKTDPNERFFLVVTADGESFKLPFRDARVNSAAN